MTATSPATGRLWFFANTAEIKLSQAASGGSLAMVELSCPPGDMPPLHVHRDDDEAWMVLEGEVSFFVGSDQPSRVGAGGVAFGPKGVPHTYRVESATPARLIAVCTPGGFDAFVQAASRPAESDGLPPASAGPPTEEQLAAVTALALQHGIELLGPPGALPGGTS